MKYILLNSKGKVPQWVEVEACKLLANPKCSLRIEAGIERKRSETARQELIREQSVKDFVLKQLKLEATTAESDSARISALGLLGKSAGIFTEVIEQRSDSRTSRLAYLSYYQPIINRTISTLRTMFYRVSGIFSDFRYKKPTPTPLFLQRVPDYHIYIVICS